MSSYESQEKTEETSQRNAGHGSEVGLFAVWDVVRTAGQT